MEDARSVPEDVVEFHGEVRVASRIIDYLSSGLYESPAACLKELVNNGYDADATEVRVFVKPDADRIIIEDNGFGMTRSEFERHFQRVAESHKRDEDDSTPVGRPKIGKIGIGLIAANEICDLLEIQSTKAGSAELLRVTLNFSLMRLDPEQRRRERSDFAKGDYTGSVTEEAGLEEHYTKLYLLEIRGPARAILAGATDALGDSARSLYGLRRETIEMRLKDRTDWDQFDRYSQTMLHVGLNVPVRYHEHWVPPHLTAAVESIKDRTAKLNFTVLYDGSELRKPIAFSPPEDSAIFEFEHDGKEVAASGYFYAQRQVLKPRQLQGLLIRIRHAAVGGYDETFLNFPGTRYPLFQHWISAEVSAGDQLEDAMNIDRRTFRDTHPAYVEFRAAFHSRLVDVLTEVRERFYQLPSHKRNEERVAQQQYRVQEAIKKASPLLGRQASARLQDGWSDIVGHQRERSVLRKFTVADVYEIVLEVAEATLTKKDFAVFAQELDKRLRA